METRPTLLLPATRIPLVIPTEVEDLVYLTAKNVLTFPVYSLNVILRHAVPKNLVFQKKRIYLTRRAGMETRPTYS